MTDPVVVDASVAIKWTVRESLHQQAGALLLEPERLVAPDLLLTEVANAGWRKHRQREITAEQARDMVAFVHRGIAVFHDTPDLIDRALAIALDLDHPVYDCIYLACAEASGGILVTDDRRLLATIDGTDLQQLVRPLASYVR